MIIYNNIWHLHSLSIDDSQSYVLGNSSVVKIYIIRPKPDQLRKMQLISSPAGRLGVAFFATGPGLGLIMYILTTLEFPKHNFDYHDYL